MALVTTSTKLEEVHYPSIQPVVLPQGSSFLKVYSDMNGDYFLLSLGDTESSATDYWIMSSYANEELPHETVKFIDYHPDFNLAFFEAIEYVDSN